eukprot:9593394-Alexandrium_andersonii.AAC.1
MPTQPPYRGRGPVLVGIPAEAHASLGTILIPHVADRADRAKPHEPLDEDDLRDIPVDARDVENGVGAPPLDACH